MARRCTVCAHPSAHQINQALIGGASIRDISGRFHLSRTAVGNHTANHLRQRIAEGMAALSCDDATTPPPVEPETMELARKVHERAEAHTAESVSLRERLARDLAGLDRIHAVALANGNLAGATRAIQTRWNILARAGLLANLDTAPDTKPEPEENVQSELAAIFRQLLTPLPEEETNR
jgi:hypothetical protein